ncbi:pyrroloquinoline quinone biosynthesis peptide chaperone PqqD [Rhodoblastus sp.]|jgi:pyrroloquinoline quinone biosynthesis protein D|uniref:pyrroloquinoline quinone biosynthesis peptide chaperone PqqD n=1 Tax=Rhodoblastus sp. TaxID=1962975 RepID=UPI0025CFAC2D|nr:pyrroloquinoline quinone biosynthesis peptide chaperone PqqD [Rhodoblastus sp.]
MNDETPLRPEDAVELNPTHHFRWEEPQQAHVLLYPEGIVKLNETAAAIIEAAIAAPTIDAAAKTIASRYGRDDLEPKIMNFLEDARAKGWIRVKS